MTVPALAVVAIVGLGTAAAMDAFLSTADALTANVGIVLARVAPPRWNPDGGMQIVHACFTYSDLIRGQQIGLLTFLLGGVPCALIASAIERARRTVALSPADWSSYLHAGLVFQVCSLGLGAFLLVVLTAAAAVVEPSAVVNPFSAILVLFIACNVWGLGTWRALQCEAPIVLFRLSR